MQKIVFLDRDTVAPHIHVRRPKFDHEWIEYDRTPAELAAERLKDATIAINNKVPLRRETLEALPNLRLIAIAATGYDCVDIAACRDLGIAVCNIRGYAINTVPEHAFSLILALRRSILAYREDVKRGEWNKADQFCFFNHPIRDLAGSNLVIMGEGSIGQSVAAIGRAFGMNIMFAAHKGSTGLGPLYTPWDEALAQADVISIHCPLMPSTEWMIGMAEFRQMSRHPIIVNTARGRLVVEEDLATALREGLIAGAGFDVTDGEPPAPDSPLMKLLDQPNFILTPHIAWASDEAQQTLVDQMIDNIENFMRDAPSNIVA
ncbi:D-2-hydroxyacid dehydrogenase [uncultured Cohaesibacter sp.]|uniref:D-2-hydroxyacid dehydrogenase n=1 Tax=uncultured Cohaesibacter sp. TaxID=1002546 RepID=UPI0029C7D570|nr:D-2-hydroxyacid dehydrogenase [uncultured Cohaesibacter sp.]